MNRAQCKANWERHILKMLLVNQIDMNQICVSVKFLSYNSLSNIHKPKPLQAKAMRFTHCNIAPKP